MAARGLWLQLRVAPPISARRGKSRAALAVVLLWIPFTCLNLVFPGQLLTYSFGLILASTSVAILVMDGEGHGTAGLRWAAPSRSTTSLLAITLLAAWPVLALFGRSEPWDWRQVLLAAPASAVGQEIYFRGALQAALSRLISAPAAVIVLVQAVLFSVWHMRAFDEVSTDQAVAVLGIALLAGTLWGWLALRDRTIAWVTVHHLFFLAVQ